MKKATETKAQSPEKGKKDWIMRVPVSVIRDSGLHASAVRVWLVIDSYKNKEGISWPSLETISRDANLGRKVVQKYIRQLKGGGLLKVDPPKRKGGGATIYTTKTPSKDEDAKRPSSMYHYDRSIFTSKDGNGYTETRSGNKIIVTSIGSHNSASADDHPDSCDCFHCQRSTEPADPNSRFTHYRSCDCLDCHKINFPED